MTFAHADTLDKTHNKLSAGRMIAEIGRREKSYGVGYISLLGSSNRNEVGDQPVNRTTGKRRTIGVEGGHHIGKHQFIAALESEREEFKARDTAYGGFTDQDRSRKHQSITAEWRATDLGPVSADIAVRQDFFSSFKDATTYRIALKLDVGSGVSIAGNYGEGIGQPSFFDLYGFFPGSFVGNPDLKPESSRGGDISLRYSAGRLGGSLTYYRQRLKDEIVDVFDPSTFLSSTVNASGKSKRQGVEIEGSLPPSNALRMTATYAWLDASEPNVGGGQLKEQRRPKHSGSVALDGTRGRLTYGAAIAYTGDRVDTNFDVFPAARVRLGRLLAGQRPACLSRHR